MDLCQQGDATVGERLELFKRQKEKLEQQMAVFRQYMEKIDFKIAYYAEAVANGSVDIYKRNKCLAAERERLFGHK